MSSLNGGARIHGVIKVTCMAWHASIAVGGGVRGSAQRPFGVIPRGRPKREQSQFVSLAFGLVRSCQEAVGGGETGEGGDRKVGLV